MSKPDLNKFDENLLLSDEQNNILEIIYNLWDSHESAGQAGQTITDADEISQRVVMDIDKVRSVLRDLRFRDIIEGSTYAIKIPNRTIEYIEEYIAPTNTHVINNKETRTIIMEFLYGKYKETGEKEFYFDDLCDSLKSELHKKHTIILEHKGFLEYVSSGKMRLTKKGIQYYEKDVIIREKTASGIELGGLSLVQKLILKKNLDQQISNCKKRLAVIDMDMIASTAMKIREKDDTKVIVTFNAFHEMVKSIIFSHGGEILITAGDQHIVLFDSSSHAVLCCKNIINRLKIFNKNKNLLGREINLRFGIDQGEMFVEYEKKPEEWARKEIDMACHLEKCGGLFVPDGNVVSITESCYNFLEDNMKKEFERKYFEKDNVYVWVLVAN